jgi:hypothetical protein
MSSTGLARSHPHIEAAVEEGSASRVGLCNALGRRRKAKVTGIAVLDLAS